MKAEDVQSLELKMQAQEVIYLDTVRLCWYKSGLARTTENSDS